MTKTREQNPRTKRLAGMVSLMMAVLLCWQSAPANESAPAVGRANAATNDRMEAPVVAAYVFDKGNLNLRSSDAKFLTQINYSFGLIKNGRVTGDHWQGIKTFESFIKKNPHILPVLAVGGWGADGFSQAAATKEGRELFAQSTIELMEAHGFLGVDIDWEYPGSSVAGITSSKDDKENFALLLQQLRSDLDKLTKADGKPRYLSIAVGASQEQANNLAGKNLGTILDQVNVMTYDLRGFEKTTGHHTNLYSQTGDEASAISGDAAITAFANVGIPRSKLVLGTAFYGRAWRSVSGGDDGLGQKAETSGNKHYVYDEIKKLIAGGTFEEYWDEQAKASYLFDGSTFISYESTQSIALKGKYAVAKGLQGAMFWEYSQDASGDLLEALYNALH